MHKGFLFSTSSPTIDICCLFDNSHSDWYEMVSHCGFDLHFPNYLWYLASFYVLLAICMSLFGEMTLSCAHILIKLFIFLLFTFINSYIIWISRYTIIRYIIWEYILPCIRLSFFFLIFIVIQLQLCAFSPHPSTPPQVNPPPSPTSTLPLGFVHVSFIVVPVIPSSHCPPPK